MVTELANKCFTTRAARQYFPPPSLVMWCPGFAANERAAYALLMTQIATATGALSWLAAEWAACRHPSFLAVVSGAIAGLVAITPACGCTYSTCWNC